MEWTGNSLRSVKKFVSTITKAFGDVFKAIVLQKGSLCSFSILAFGKREVFEKDVFTGHLIDYAEKSAGAEKADAKDLEDTITVLKRLMGKSEEQAKQQPAHKCVVCADVLLDILKQTIRNIGQIVPAYVNKMTQLKEFSLFGTKR